MKGEATTHSTATATTHSTTTATTASTISSTGVYISSCTSRPAAAKTTCKTTSAAASSRQTSSTNMIHAEDRNSQAAVVEDEDRGMVSSPSGGAGKIVLESKCVCGWKNCAIFQRVFRDCKHPVYNGFVKIKLIKKDPECVAYKASLDRTLRIPAAKRNDWKVAEGSGGGGSSSKEYIRYSIARHHFTEKHIMKYLADPKQYSFVKPFSLHGAKKYLFEVNLKETIVTGSYDVLYLQTPNVSTEHVEKLFMQIMQSLPQQQKKPKQQQQHDDDNKATSKKQTSNSSSPEGRQQQQQQPCVLKKIPINNGNSRMPRSSSSLSPLPAAVASQPPPAISPNTSDEDGDDDISYDSSSTDSDAIAGGQRGDAENCGPGRGNGGTRALRNDNNNNVAGNKSVSELMQLLQEKEAENRRLREQFQGMQEQVTYLHDMVRKLQEEHFENKSVRSGTQRSSTHNRGGGQQSGHSRSNRSRSGRTNTSTSMRSRLSGVPNEIELGEDDDESGSYDVRRESGGWGANPTDGYRGNNESGNDLDWSEQYDEGDIDDNQTTATFLKSASASVRSLPREIELDLEDDEDHESLEEEAFEVRSVIGSGSRSGTTGDREKDRRSSQGMSAASISSRRSSVKDSDEKSVSSRKSAVSSHSRSAGTYQVTNLVVTDPYGEKGTYTGSISYSTVMPHGFGRLEYERAGRWYEGDWKHGRWTGQGRLSNGDGDFYEGSLKNDHKDGYGVMKFADGRTFEGEYKNGQMIEGKMTYQDGSTYSGTWVDGMRHGRGKCVFTDNSIYQGEFKGGEFYGYGKMTWSDGGWYEGEWCNGEMHGRGKEVRPDGTLRHDGEWSKGQPIRR